MKSNLIVALVFAFLVGGLIGWYIGKSDTGKTNSIKTVQAQKEQINQKQLELKMDMRKLWSDHVFWTRAYLISEASNSEDLNVVSTRLLKNQQDIGDAIKPYYGENAGNQLTTLLKEHITTAVDLVKAAKTNNQQALSAANTKWYNNADAIASFLSSANPNWKQDDMKMMMKEHLDLTKQAAVEILGGKNEESIKTFDKIFEQILEMADGLSDGVIAQFPDKF